MTSIFPGQEGTTIKYYREKAGFHVGQEGEFLLHDSFMRPIETVRGQIISLIEGRTSLYAMLRTESGVRPGRLI